MTVDMPQPHREGQLRQLWKEAFGDSDAFLDGFFATGFAPERCRCLCWNDRVAAALYWFDCEWKGRKLAYIYAVATLEDFRGKGFCRSLMENTHQHLKKLGYHGAVLVPGSRELFALYGKLGYQSICPKGWTEIKAEQPPEQIRPLTQQAFAAKRRLLLPPDGILQEGPALSYLATFAGFYEAEGCLFCGSGDPTFFFQEFLGKTEKLPGILAALQADTGRVPCPNTGPDSAMYYPLTDEAELPAYFGLSLN